MVCVCGACCVGALGALAAVLFLAILFLGTLFRPRVTPAAAAAATVTAGQVELGCSMDGGCLPCGCDVMLGVQGVGLDKHACLHCLLLLCSSKRLPVEAGCTSDTRRRLWLLCHALVVIQG